MKNKIKYIFGLIIILFIIGIADAQQMPQDSVQTYKKDTLVFCEHPIIETTLMFCKCCNINKCLKCGAIWGECDPAPKILILKFKDIFK